MPQFRKKPSVIEAEQFRSGQLVKGLCVKGNCWINRESHDQDPLRHPHVHTIHNNQPVNLTDGDWVIPEPDGEHFYPCKPDIFAATYEATITGGE